MRQAALTVRTPGRGTGFPGMTETILTRGVGPPAPAYILGRRAGCFRLAGRAVVCEAERFPRPLRERAGWDFFCLGMVHSSASVSGGFSKLLPADRAYFRRSAKDKDSYSARDGEIRRDVLQVRVVALHDAEAGL